MDKVSYKAHYVMKTHLKYLLRYITTSIFCFAARPEVQSAINAVNRIL